jgi:two-component system sensor histidine kinase PilS (NtrC family)
VSFLSPTTHDNVRLLGTYVYYRLGLGLILGLMHWAGLSRDVFGYVHPQLFTNVVIFYIIVCTLSLILYRGKSLKPYSAHLLALLAFDFAALVSMIYSSGNLTGGLGYLLLIPMAVGSSFLRGQANIGLAAFGTILVLGMSLLSIKNGASDVRGFFTAGVTGLALFVTAIAFRIFSEKVKVSENTAKKQTEQANYLQLISQKIVETMRTGIIVVDRDLRIQLINNAAALMLTINNKFEGIKGIPSIYKHLKSWKENGVIPSPFTLTLEDNQSIKVSFAYLNDSRFPSIMLFIEDMQRLGQEAQQLKLASLGRLTASIAHEIRNPLGAISHASQLLEESKSINNDDQKLLTIIHNHSQRINFIINNILDFSRRKNADPETINLNQWLSDFKSEYLQHHIGSIEVIYRQRNIYAKIDSTHLHQIISNLVENGMRYSLQKMGREIIKIVIDIQENTHRPFIEIIDYGSGIDDEKTHHLFEPFYTTEVTGSGLGLYLCKELSEANQANLSYHYDKKNKSSLFKLVLAHHQRRIELQ